MCYSNLAERLRRRRSSVEMNMSVYPGDLLVQDPHKKLLKRNTISDFYPTKNGTTTPVDGKCSSVSLIVSNLCI